MKPVTASLRDRSLASLERLPRLSSMMMQLIAKLSRPGCGVAELTAVIERDPLLSGQVLSIANSALFRRLQEITAVDRAVMLIGVGTLRRFALGFSIANLFRSFRAAPSFSMTRFNLHSVGAAMLVEAISREVPVDFPDEAFISGILHDIGTLLIAVTLPEEFESIHSMAAVGEMKLTDCERSVLDVDHAELSALAVKRWGLSDGIQQTLRYHHEPDKLPSQIGPMPGKLHLSQVLNKADAFVNFLGISTLTPPALVGKPPSLEFEGFPYPEDRVLEAFEREWKTVGDLFH